jgi:dTDP-glucose 4,6-dehydratase
MTTYLVTGGAGFIGGNFVHHLMHDADTRIVVLDKMTYAGNAQTLAEPLRQGRCELVVGDIQDRALVRSLPTSADSFCGRKPCGSLHPRPARICDDQCGGHLQFA